MVGKKYRPAVLAALWVALLAMLAAGCGAGAGAGPGPGTGTLVYTTIFPVYDFTSNVCGDRARVVQLVPDGAEPHDWEPSPRDVAGLKQADVFIYNGAGMEAWVDKLLRAQENSQVLAVDCSAGAELLPAPGGKGVDPHIWLDPLNAALMVDNIARAMQQADPANAAYYRENAGRYKARLEELHEKYAATLAKAKLRKFVVSHAAFGYLARRYGLEQVAVLGISPSAAPGPARMAEIIETVRREGIKYIFCETLVSTRVPDIIAKEAGVKTLVLNPLGGITSRERRAGRDYLSIMEENLHNLSLALEVQK